MDSDVWSISEEMQYEVMYGHGYDMDATVALEEGD